MELLDNEEKGAVGWWGKISAKFVPMASAVIGYLSILLRIGTIFRK